MTETPEGISLIRAVYQCRLRLTRLLVEGGAYINESNDRGETPLMVACRTKHVDAQSASKEKIVKYLLENKADPNIQDKSGKTALMHACMEKAGPEVVSLLLSKGADPSLQDHSNCSALVYAINSEDRETLEVLLNACREQGKEVIIITVHKSLSGRLKTKQYLNMPPEDFEECCSPVACTSPSEIELKTSLSPDASPNETKKAFFSFKELDPPRSRRVDNSSQTVSPMRKSSSRKVGSQMARVQWLHSEPWVKSSLSMFHQDKIASLQELQAVTPEEEEVSFNISGLGSSNRFITRHQSIDIKDTPHLLKTLDQTGSRKLSDNEKNYQTPYAEEEYNSSGIPEGKDASSGQISFLSNIRSIIQKTNLGANHCSSDSQLTTSLSPAAAEDSKSVIGKKKILSPSHSLLPSSREEVESMPLVTSSRRNQPLLERWDSGALLLDQAAQTRPGFLPPLNVNPYPPITDTALMNRASGMISCGQKHLVPAAPAFPRETENKKTLLRRQSLQSEQIKQLMNF
ncbi:ankyrin repeat domain-containing protein 34B [Balearica regulorum gibbericeps]|uniref:ankyrin repeat domain-containing protein 34B n=1 Tax=Balearica regulorum gibbericeps TaxID=100784 RepID=UPI003F62D9C7